MHAKYEVSISYGSKVIAKVKVDNRQTNRQTERQTDKQTGQKQYAPDHSIRGHKKESNMTEQYGCDSPIWQAHCTGHMVRQSWCFQMF